MGGWVPGGAGDLGERPACLSQGCGLRVCPATRPPARAYGVSSPLPRLPQIRFRQLQPSGVIREMEGVHAVVALLPGADPAAQLQQATDDLLLSLGVINGVAASGGVAAAERSPGAAVHGAASAPPLALRELNGVPPLPSLPGASPSAGICQAGSCSVHGHRLLQRMPLKPPRVPPTLRMHVGLPSQRPKRCIVVLHHKVKTRWMPPGVSRLLKGGQLVGSVGLERCCRWSHTRGQAH